MAYPPGIRVTIRACIRVTIRRGIRGIRAGIRKYPPGIHRLLSPLSCGDFLFKRATCFWVKQFLLCNVMLDILVALV